LDDSAMRGRNDRFSPTAQRNRIAQTEIDERLIRALTSRFDYKWIALSNTTLGVLMTSINSSIVLIALPATFTGLHVDPLTPGNTVSGFLASVARGGLQFMLIIWLQGIWLPIHGCSFSETPLWTGIYMLPMMVGFLVAGPLSGYLSDRYGARPFSPGGMLLACVTFLGLTLLPANFTYLPFSILLFLNGVGMGLFSIALPFMDGLRDAFYVLAAMAFVAAIASLLRGRQYFHEVSSRKDERMLPAIEHSGATPLQRRQEGKV
jgi:MFS family permease